MGAGVDCEVIGVFGQPVNATTALAFVALGLWVVSASQAGNRVDRPRPWIGAGLVATGFGSFLFHGPLAPGGVWIHDATLAWLLFTIAAHRATRLRYLMPVSAVILGLVVAASPGNDLLMAVLAVAALGAVLSSIRNRHTVVALAVLGGSALVGRLGATGGPLCDPTSVMQPHGIWHVGAAAAVTMWVRRLG